jgi:hypothetical protein
MLTFLFEAKNDCFIRLIKGGITLIQSIKISVSDWTGMQLNS